MNKTYNQISRKTGICVCTLRQYFCRPEFSHIGVANGICHGITKEDIEKVQELFNNRKKRRQ